jgi:putative ABC transport system substrate-binding protein
MKRRDLLVAVGALLAAPLARSQGRAAGASFRIGLFPAVREEPFLRWLHDALNAAGWQPGRNYVFVPSRATYSDPPTVAGARQLLEQKVDLVMVASTAHAVATHRATPRVPIVMWASGYPVEAGVAASLARPGKNVTGVTVYAGTGIWGKLLELLREAKPEIKRVGVAWGYVPPAFPREEIEPCYRELRRAAGAIGLGLHIEEIARPEAVPTALAAIEAARPGALLIMAGPGFYAERSRIMQFAVAKRLPSAVDFRWPPDVELRPLLTYGAFFPALMNQAAAYVVRILQGGAQPGSLPIQQPAKFELVVELNAARAIGLTVPQPLLLHADEVIE